MGFGKRLRKRVSRARRAVTAPVRKALTPIVGKRVAGVLANPGGAIVSAAHPVTSAYGKVLGSVYGIGFGGLVGARVIANRPDLGGKAGSDIARAAIQIEKPLLAAAGGLVAGGIGSSVAGGIGDAIAGDTGQVPSGRDFNSFGADSSPFGDAPAGAAGRKSLSSTTTTLILVVIGGTVLVAFVFAMKKRRR